MKPTSLPFSTLLLLWAHSCRDQVAPEAVGSGWTGGYYTPLAGTPAEVVAQADILRPVVNTH